MADYGFVALQKKMLNWEWYKDTNTKSVFIHLLLKANWKDDRWRGIDVKRGQVVTSIGHLSDELNITERSVRTALEHLTKSGEIDKQTTSKYSVITIKNYDKYQSSDKQSADKTTGDVTSNVSSDRQTNGEQSTTDKQFKQTKQDKQFKQNNNNPPISPQGEKRETACSIIESRNLPVDVEKLIKDWVEYKSERRESYKPRGLTAFITEVQKYIDIYGFNTVSEVVNRSMSQNYQGVVWDWCKDCKTVERRHIDNSDIDRWVNKNDTS